MVLQLTGAGRTARDVLALLIDTPGQELHTREIARRVSADPHPVHRALAHLLAAGVIQSRPLGNLRLWSVREDSPLVPPMRDLIRQTSGVAARLRTALGPMKGLQFAFLFGSYAAGRDERDSDIDLFLVGAVDWRRLSLIATQLAADLGRDIEPVVWTLEELGSPTRRDDGSSATSSAGRGSGCWGMTTSSSGSVDRWVRGWSHLIVRVPPDPAAAGRRLVLAETNVRRAKLEHAAGDDDAALIFAEQALINAADALLSRDGYRGGVTRCATHVSPAARRLFEPAPPPRPDPVDTERRSIRRRGNRVSRGRRTRDRAGGGSGPRVRSPARIVSPADR